MSDELVRVRDLKKIFSVPAGELHAVDGVDFSIARGSTIGIVGESGCGKSTMGRLLAMLLEATSGEILFDGQNIAKKMSKAEAMAYKKRIQMIFQDPFSSLNPRMTTFETIIEPLNIHRAGTLQEREARVYQLMETVGLSERFVNAYPHELDGGRRQRIGIARALALDPEFIICDEPVSALDVSIQAQILNLNPRMTTFETIIEPLNIHRAGTLQEREARVYQLMETVGLSERFVNAYPHELDGGRRQRIGIARALALDPEFIICDEPVSALDVSIQAQILNLLKRLQQQNGYTYLFITHDLAVVKHISNEVLVMYLGQMVEKAPTAELFRNPRHPYTQALLSAIPVPSLDEKKPRMLLKGELTSPINPKPACRFAPRCPYAKEQCRCSVPEITDLGSGHTIRCFYPQG